MSITVNPSLLRLAFVQEWSDALILRALSFQKGTAEMALTALRKAADDINISKLRGSDDALFLAGIQVLGFESRAEFNEFVLSHPMLSDAQKAPPAIHGGAGRVTALSMTEVIFLNGDTALSFDRARIDGNVAIGSRVIVSPRGKVLVKKEAYSDALIDPLFRAQIQGLKDMTAAIDGTDASSVAFSTDPSGLSYSKNRVELDSLAAAEDGAPDMDQRNQALRPRST